MNNFDKLYLSINLLIDISEEVQKKQILNKQYLSPTSWAKEFCTLKISTSRGTGHTSCIKKLIEDRFNKNVILLFPSVNFLNNFKYQLKEKPSYPILNINCNLRGIELSNKQAIIIDNSCFLSSQKINTIYSCFGVGVENKNPFFFIFVQ